MTGAPLEGLLLEIRRVEHVDAVRLYDFDQRVLFSPAARGERFIKLAVTEGRRGARSRPHAHTRDEVTLTLIGEAVLHAGGRSYAMTEGIAVRLPPGLVHEVEVISERWVVVVAYCDECTLCRGGDGVSWSAPMLSEG